MTSQIGVSNTEVQNAYACELAWGFGFHPEMNYQKRDMGIARTRGIIGHSALEIYYRDLKEEVPVNEAAQHALNYINDLRVKELLAGDDFVDNEQIEMLNWLYVTLQKYFEYYEEDAQHWEILDVEAFHAMEQDGETDFYLPARLDLVIYQKSGKFKGETSPVDHKFSAQFWNKSKLILNSQFPLYILALRAAKYAGKPNPIVRRVIVNQIRTGYAKAAQPHDFLRRSFEPYSTVKLQNVFKNHMKSAVHLAYLKRLGWEEFLSEARVALGSMACQYCDFKDLCDATFEENDPTNVIAATLKPNEYGYPPLEVIRRERN